MVYVWTFNHESAKHGSNDIVEHSVEKNAAPADGMHRVFNKQFLIEIEFSEMRQFILLETKLGSKLSRDDMILCFCSCITLCVFGLTGLAHSTGAC
jgi:hypothetical protein